MKERVAAASPRKTSGKNAPLLSYGQIVEHSPVATCLTDHSGRILHMNRALTMLCGLATRAARRKNKAHFTNLIGDQKAAEGILRKLQSERSLQNIAVFLQGEGTKPTWVKVSAAVIDEPKPDCMLLFHFFASSEEEHLPDADLSTRLKVEETVTRVSRLLIETGDLDLCLKELGEMIGVTNAYIFRFRNKCSIFDNIHEWCKNPASSQMQKLQGLRSGMMPKWMKKLHKRENIVIQDISVLEVEDEELRRMSQEQGTKSLLMVPLYIQSELIGFICLTDTEKARPWSDFEIRFLSVIAETIRSHLWRKKAEVALEESERIYRQIVERSAVGVTVIKKSKLLFANKAAESILGNPAGDTLDDKLQNFLSIEENRFLWRNAIARLEAKDVPTHYESKILTLAGEERFIDVDAHLVSLAGEAAVFATFVDITKRKKSESLLQQRADQLSLLQHIAEVVGQSLDLNVLLTSSLQNVMHVTRAKAGVIYLLNNEGTALEMVKCEGIKPKIAESLRVVTKQICRTWRVIESGEPDYVENTKKANDVFPPAKKLGFASFISLPLRAEGTVIGTLNIGGFDKKAFTLLPNELLSSIGSEIGIAIQNARLYNKLQTELEERRRIEAALLESEEKFRKLAEIIPIGVNVMVSNKNAWLNNAFASMFGYDREEMLGKGPELVFAPQELAALLKTARGWLSGRRLKPEIYETIGVKKNGDPISISVKAESIKFGEQDAVLVLVEDITKRREAEDALRESERRYRSLFEESPISLWEEDFSEIKRYTDALKRGGVDNFADYFESHPDEALHCMRLAKVIDINKKTLEMYHCTAKEHLLSDLNLISSEETISAHKEFIIAIAEGKTQFEIETVNKTLTGEKIWITLRWSVAHGHEDSYSKVLVSIIGISELKRTEAILKESERRYRDTIERSLDGYYFIDKHGRIEYVNSALTQIFSYSRKELIGMDFQILLDPAQKEHFKPIFSRIMGGRPVHWHEVGMKRKDGKVVWIGFNARRVIRDGVVIGAEGFLKDITKERADEDALRASEARFRALFDSIPFEVFGIGSDGRYREVNRNFIRNWGNFVGRTPRKAIADAEHAEFMSSFVKESLAARSTIEKDYVLEKNQDKLYYTTILNPVITPDDQVLGLVGINMDVTNQVVAFERSQHLAARLVEIQEEERSRIALEIHDSLGQYLTALQLEIGAAANAIDADSKRASELLAASKKTVEQAMVTAQSLCYTLRPPLLDDFGLVAALKDYIDEFAKKWGIEIDFTHAEVESTLSQLEEMTLLRVTQEALWNILKHAQASKASVQLVKETNSIRLTISDNGKGFKVTEFFSKGSSGRFGIIGMQERASMLGGSFNIQSVEGQGTVVTFTLSVPKAN